MKWTSSITVAQSKYILKTTHATVDLTVPWEETEGNLFPRKEKKKKPTCSSQNERWWNITWTYCLKISKPTGGLFLAARCRLASSFSNCVTMEKWPLILPGLLFLFLHQVWLCSHQQCPDDTKTLCTVFYGRSYLNRRLLLQLPPNRKKPRTNADST